MVVEKAKRIVPYVVISLVAAYFYVLAGQFRFSAKPGHLGPDFWPKVLLALTMAACLYEIVRILFFVRTPPKEVTSEPKKPDQPGGVRETYPELLVIGVLMTLAYAYFVTTLGFVLSTFLYFVLFMVVGRYRKVWAILANSLLGTLVLVVVFMKIVYVSLPHGKEPFSEVTFFVLRILGVK